MSRNSTLMKITALFCALGCFGFTALAEPNVVYTPQFEFTASPDPLATDIHALPEPSPDHGVYVIRDLGDASHLACLPNVDSGIAVARDAKLTACGMKETRALRSTIDLEIVPVTHTAEASTNRSRKSTSGMPVANTVEIAARDAKLTAYGMTELRVLRSTTYF